jgi:hypothetical protein
VHRVVASNRPDQSIADDRCASGSIVIAPNPLAPTLRETIYHALDEHEREQFVAHLRDTFTSTQPIQLWASAYLAARS